MVMIHNLLKTLMEPDTVVHKPDPMIYEAVKVTTQYGISNDNTLITGLELVPYANIEEGYSLLTTEIQEIGTEVIVHLPEGGLVEGKLYVSKATNISRDWEMGIIDDYDITIEEYVAPNQLDLFDS